MTHESPDHTAGDFVLVRSRHAGNSLGCSARSRTHAGTVKTVPYIVFRQDRT